MLRIIKTPCPDSKKKLFLEASTEKALWIVSHLEAKAALQDHALQTSLTISNQNIQRASEYWRWLFAVNCPEWRSQSESFTLTNIANWFEDIQIDPQRKDPELFYQFFGQAVPLIVAANADLVREWIRQNPERRERLEFWYELGEKFWLYLNEKKALAQSWAPTILLQQESLYFGEYEHFYFDLGVDLKTEEVDLILTLARDHEVNVVVPQTAWTDRYQSAMSVYNKLLAAADTTETLGPLGLPRPRLRPLEFASVLREVKQVVAEVRGHLDRGVLPSEIAILSEPLEDYWILLREHFRVEGIPVQKASVLRALSLPEVQTWMARLRLLNREFESPTLETALFGDDREAGKDYTDFKKNFSQIYDLSQARTHFQLAEDHSMEFLPLSEFVELMYAHWKADDVRVLEELVDTMVEDATPEETQSFSAWIDYIERLLSKTEQKVIEGDEGGIAFYRLGSADWSDHRFLYVLGCEQKNLTSATQSPLSMDDLFLLENDLGFVLQRTENTKNEFDLRWLLEKSAEDITLSCSRTDFEGEPQMLSSFWLSVESGAGREKIVPLKTRIDELMSAGYSVQALELGIPLGDQKIQAQKFALEHSLEGYEPITFHKKVTVSASSLSKYYQCPFIFYSEKVLKMREDEELDLEIDHRYQGELLHRMAEEIIRRSPDFNLTGPQLETLYDEVVTLLGEATPLKTFWLHEKRRHLNIIAGFVEMEKEHRKKFPQLRTVATEEPIHGFLSVGELGLQFSPHPKEGPSFEFFGKIDRVDQDSSGHYGIVDYKTSHNKTLKAFKNWVEAGQFQMPLYAQALESGFSENLAPQPVAAAEYVFFRDKTRGSGYIVEDSSSGFFTPNQKATSREDVEDVLTGIFTKVQEILLGIEAGQFAPRPRDVKTCETCAWRPLCRAPHLK